MSTPAPASQPVASRVRRDGTTLVFEGPLERPAVPALWAVALPLLDGAGAIDLAGVSHVDSAGLALLAELQARAGGGLEMNGDPAGLPGLRHAYRLGPALRPA